MPLINRCGGGGGADVSSVTATAADVLEGKTIVGTDGEIIMGEMPDQTEYPGEFMSFSDTYPIENGWNYECVEIPKGYHDGGGRIYVQQLSETITPTEEEQIFRPGTGYRYYGVKVNPIPSDYVKPVNIYQDAVTITPDQVLYRYSDGSYFEKGLVVEGDLNLKAENIKKDETIFGVTGTLESGATVDVRTYSAGVFAEGTMSFSNVTKQPKMIALCPSAIGHYPGATYTYGMIKTIGGNGVVFYCSTANYMAWIDISSQEPVTYNSSTQKLTITLSSAGVSGAFMTNTTYKLWIIY